jgi:hypothetical protein
MHLPKNGRNISIKRMIASTIKTNVYSIPPPGGIERKKLAPLARKKIFSPGREMKVPTTFEEALAVVDKIRVEKKGEQNRYYGQPQLKEIAVNLGISSTGDKTTLVNTIRDALQLHFGRDFS